MYIGNRIPTCSNMWPSSVVTSCDLCQLWPVCPTANICPPSALALSFRLQASASAFSLSLHLQLQPSDSAFRFGQTQRVPQGRLSLHEFWETFLILFMGGGSYWNTQRVVRGPRIPPHCNLLIISSPSNSHKQTFSWMGWISKSGGRVNRNGHI